MDKMSLIRTIILGIAFANQLLVVNHASPLPIEDASVETLVSTIFTIGAATWTWWKNNYVSKRGQEQKEVLQKSGLYKP